jgi:outer membrane receptor protein involved in Fe transport
MFAAFALFLVSSSAQAPFVSPAATTPSTGVVSYPADFFKSYQPITAGDMVSRLPGFTLDDGQSARGYANAAGNVLVDSARPPTKSDSLSDILRRIPAAQVERIDVITGGAPGVDMLGKTVVANIIRRAGGGRTIVVTAADNLSTQDGRNAPQVRAEFSDRHGQTALEGSLRAAEFFDDSGGAGSEAATSPSGEPLYKLRDNTKAAGLHLEATGSYLRPLFAGALKVNGFLESFSYTYAERDQDTSSLLIPPGIERDRDNHERGEFGLTFDRTFGALATQTLFIQQIEGEDFLSRYSAEDLLERFREQHTDGESILRTTATYAWSHGITFEAGAEGDYNWFNTHTSYFQNGDVITLPAADIQFVELRGEAFAKATMVVDPHLTVEVGLRGEASNLVSRGDVVLDKTLFYPKPRAVIAWSPTAHDQLRLRFEEEVGQLDFGYFVATTALNTGQVYAGNPNLTPQRATVFEAAFEHRFWGTGDATLTIRRAALENVIDRAPILNPAGNYDAPANIGAGSQTDLTAALTVPLTRLKISGGQLVVNAVWRTSSVKDPTTGTERPISGLRPLEGGLEFDQDLPAWRLKWGVSYHLGWRQPYYRFSEVEIDAFRPYGGLFVEYKHDAHLSFRAEINDIGVDYRRTLEIFPDLRNQSLQTSTDVRDLYFAPSILFKVRREL